MKKLLFLATVAIAVVGCKKETALTPTPVKEVHLQDQVESLIKKADAGLYNSIFSSASQRKPYVSVDFIRGTFVAQGGDISSGTCYPTNSVCMVLVSALQVPEDATSNLAVSEIKEDVTLLFGSDVSTSIILNTTPLPTIKNNISAFTADFNQQTVSIGYR